MVDSCVISVSETKRPGRPPTYLPQRRATREIHLNMGVETWNAVRQYCESIGELSISLAVRRLLRERLSELGYLNKNAALPSSATKNP